MTLPDRIAHGERRNRRQVVTIDPPATYVTADGEKITMPVGSHEETREEYYCVRHGWSDEGFLGPLLWPAHHGDCE